MPAKSSAQTYQHALGLRFGNGSISRTLGLTSNHRIAKGWSLEAIGQTDFSDTHTAHLLIKRNKGIISRRFNFYYGTGLSLGSEESFVKDPQTRQKIFTYGNTTFGVDFIGGIELTLLKLNLSLDVKPNINISGRQNWMTFQTGFSVRSVIVTRGQASRNRRQKERARKQRDRDQARNRNEPTGLGKQSWWPFGKGN